MTVKPDTIKAQENYAKREFFFLVQMRESTIT